MKEYYFSNGEDQEGPFNLNELEGKNIKPDTLIWYEGLGDWTKAENIEEIKLVLKVNKLENQKHNNITNKQIKIPESSEITSSSVNSISKGMFKNVFSYHGRIRRKEYGISMIIFYFLFIIVAGLTVSYEILGLLYIPLIYFITVQSIKRCHDRGNPGWWILIPYYQLWLLFADSEKGSNEYGENPKGDNN